jgi:AraC-like DNA-binding protein
MFRELDTTIVATIRTRRLERCREDLSDPALAHRSIMEIAEHWGFGDPAHFSRAFRKQFGMTPSEVRASR